MKKKLTKLGLAILKSLQEDAALSQKQRASKLNVSAAAISQQMTQIRKGKYIRRQTAELNPERFGILVQGIMRIRVDKLSDDFIAHIKVEFAAMPSIVYCNQINGKFDIELKFAVKTIEESDQLVKSISNITNFRLTDVAYIVSPIIPDRGLYLY